MKPSRLHTSLNKKIAASPSQFERDCFRAEKAAYLVRWKPGPESEAIIKNLHTRYDASPNLHISIWLNLIGGLSIYHQAMDKAAWDKVRRAHALAVAGGIAHLSALTAAWLAQLEYMQHDIEAMAGHLTQALTLADPDHHAARSRCALVAAQALHHAGVHDKASYWHDRARFHALQEGDDATVSTLIRNMGWLRMSTWRQAVFTGKGDADDGKQALVGAESTENFDRMTGATTLMSLHPLLQAHILSLQGKPALALDIYEKNSLPADASEVSRLECNLLADRAWCHVQLGNAAMALSFARLAESSASEETHVDDQAAAHSRLAQVYAALNHIEASESHQRWADIAWQANAKLQARVTELLRDLSDDQTPLRLSSNHTELN